MGARKYKKRHRSFHLTRSSDWWQRYSYKHTTLAILAIVAFILLIDSALLAGLFSILEGLDYTGGFIAGMLSVSFFTTAPALVTLVTLAPQLDPLTLAFVAAVGSAIGDWFILLFFQEKVANELKPLFNRLGVARAMNLLDRPSTRWIPVTAGAFIVSTPLPDEIGLGMMGISHFKRAFLVVLCFFLNGVGLFALIMAARLIAA